MTELYGEMYLAEFEDEVEAGLKKLVDEQIVQRIWAKDHTVWKPEPREITNRLGWLDIAPRTVSDAENLYGLKDALQMEGYTNVLLLGMGGSSLAPEVFSKVFGPTEEGLSLDVLDSTDPGTVQAYEEALDLRHTAFVVATKSGNTAETLSFFKYFYNKTAEVAGKERAGQHFIAVTDADSNLDKLATRYGFRTTFRNDPEIGGRYSALSYFGMVAGALVGMDIEKYLRRGDAMAIACQSKEDNPGAHLGSVLGVLAELGRDKVTFITSPAVAPFADWVEQLIAESTGKEGKGILPVVGETVGDPEVYGDDHLFVYLRLEGDHTHDEDVNTLIKAGYPVIRYDLNDRYDVAGQMFLWEFATAVSGYFLEINPFDQPNVESAKKAARRMIDEYAATGKLPAEEPALVDGSIAVYGDTDAQSVASALVGFLGQVEAGDYVALQAYIQPTVEAEEVLRQIQTITRDKIGTATTLGFGPRFLHSTGQLHKGDSGNGLFVQITSTTPEGEGIGIPDEAGRQESSMPFGVLKTAQAMGDREALLAEGRRVIRFELDGDVISGINRLCHALK